MHTPSQKRGILAVTAELRLRLFKNVAHSIEVIIMFDNQNNPIQTTDAQISKGLQKNPNNPRRNTLHEENLHGQKGQKSIKLTVLNYFL